MNTPLTFRQKKFIENQVAKGMTSRKIAESLGISIWTVRKWRKRQKKKIYQCLY